MISFKVDQRYSQDLEDDFIMNKDLDLYEFIGKDPIKAFYLGYNISEWFEKIDRDQKYLYSKQIRHNKDDLDKYQAQMKFWVNRFSKESEVDLVELSEFVLNNMIWDKDSEDKDIIKMSFFFGNTIASNPNNEKVEDIH